MTVTTAELRQWLQIGGHVEQGDLPLMEMVIAAAEQSVADYCGRTFTASDEDADATVRIFAGGHDLVMVDDFTILETLEESTDRTTWTEVESSVYWTGPENDPTQYRIFANRPLAAHVRVTANFGLDSVLVAQAKLAMLMKAARLWKRRDTVSGVEGFGEFVVRVSTRDDPDIVSLLAPLRRYDRVVGVG